MKTSYTEDTAKYVAESLLDHARSVYKYTNSYCRDDEFNARFDDRTRSNFRTQANRLVENLYSMMLLTRYNGVGDVCNLEQIEAYYESAREILDIRHDVIDYAALFN